MNYFIYTSHHCAFVLVHNSSSRWKLDCGSTHSQESHQIVGLENFSDTNCICRLFFGATNIKQAGLICVFSCVCYAN